jgi:hypothetical protein
MLYYVIHRSRMGQVVRHPSLFLSPGDLLPVRRLLLSLGFLDSVYLTRIINLDIGQSRRILFAVTQCSQSERVLILLGCFIIVHRHHQSSVHLATLFRPFDDLIKLKTGCHEGCFNIFLYRFLSCLHADKSRQQ